jgi:cation transport regulator ChaC
MNSLAQPSSKRRYTVLAFALVACSQGPAASEGGAGQASAGGAASVAGNGPTETGGAASDVGGANSPAGTGGAATGGTDAAGGDFSLPTGGAEAGGVAGSAGGASAGSGGGATLSAAVTTNRNDNLRSATNLAETALTPAKITASGFGLLFSRTVDAQVYAQPLYLGGLTMPDNSRHNVVFVATSQNNVYAFDADDAASTAPLWKKSLGASGPATGFGCTDMTAQVGVTGTPVIDQQAGNLYLVSKGQESGAWVQRVHVLDVLTGNERPGSPLVISASVSGTGAGSSGGKVSFNAQNELNRPGLLLQDGTLYIAFASHCDSGAYHGWVLGYHYDGTNLAQTHAYTVSPNGSQGGIWQGGVGLSSDGASVYFAAGNGSTNPNSTPPDLSESVVRLRASDFTPQDYWTPTNYAALNKADSDLSSGATLLPHDLLMTGSKDGRLYVLDRTNLGKFNAGSDAILQTLTTPGKSNGQRGHVHGGPVYYKDPSSGDEWVLIWPESSPLMRYKVDATTRKLTGLVTAALGSPGHPGATLALSANGSTAGTAVLWAAAASGTDPDGAWHMAVPGSLYAVDPSKNPPALLWSSTQNSARDGLGNFAKFNTPTVANGHVYVATFSGVLRVYGLLH